MIAATFKSQFTATTTLIVMNKKNSSSSSSLGHKNDL